MSEQTPDTHNGAADGQDPSMEDILASIRKIIAEDDSQGADEENVLVDNLEGDLVKGDVTSLAHNQTLDLDILAEEVETSDPDIDAMLGDMEIEDETRFPEAALVLDTPVDLEAEDETEGDDILSLEMPIDESEDLVTIETIAETDDALSLQMDSEIADVLAPLDREVDETLTAELAEADLLDQVEEIDAPREDDELKSFVGGAMAALGLGGVAAAASSKSSPPESNLDASEVDAIATEPLDDDLSLMLDNMLEDSSAYQAEAAKIEETVEALETGEDLLAEIETDEPQASEALDIDSVERETDADMDLVKSLMADLTEEPLHEDIPSEEVASESVEAMSETVSEADESSDDILGDILDKTIEDEANLSEELTIPEIDMSSEDNAPMSLKEIAAAAELDAAESLNGSMGAGLGAAASLGVVGAVGATASKHQAEEEISEPETVETAIAESVTTKSDDVQSTDDILPEEPVHLTPENLTPETIISESIIEETPQMARAKKTDAIIDEVTETATAGAFASLTNVVEEKATVAERGDRIGDLVMEALQPMLKEWLDANLKGIVERAVTKEVKRISSGK